MISCVYESNKGINPLLLFRYDGLPKETVDGDLLLFALVTYSDIKTWIYIASLRHGKVVEHK